MNNNYIKVNGVAIVNDENNNINKVLPDNNYLDYILLKENKIEELENQLKKYEKEIPDFKKESKLVPLFFTLSTVGPALAVSLYTYVNYGIEEFKKVTNTFVGPVNSVLLSILAADLGYTVISVLFASIINSSKKDSIEKRKEVEEKKPILKKELEQLKNELELLKEKENIKELSETEYEIVDLSRDNVKKRVLESK